MSFVVLQHALKNASRIYNIPLRNFLFAVKPRSQKRESYLSYQQILSNIRRLIGPDVLSSTPFVSTERMIGLLQDTFTLRTLANLIEKSKSATAAQELVSSAGRFINGASFFDISHFIRVVSKKRVQISAEVSYLITRKLHESEMSTQNAISILKYHSMSYHCSSKLLLVLFAKIVPDLHTLDVREIARTLYALTLPPLKFHSVSQEWFPVILQLLASKPKVWTNSFVEINEIMSIVARGISFCTEQNENTSLKAVSLIVSANTDSWQMLMESSDEKGTKCSDRQSFNLSKKIRETVFFLSACSYIRQFGIHISESRLKSISKTIVRDIVRGSKNHVPFDESQIEEKMRADPKFMFQLNMNIIHDGNLLSKFVLALSNYAEPFIVRQVRQLFMDKHVALTLKVEDSESDIRHAMNIAMRILRSMNVINDPSTHDEEYDFLWDVIYGAICRKQTLNIFSIAASCLWNDDLIRNDCRNVVHKDASVDPTGHMESTVGMSLYMIISSYAFQDYELGNPTVLDMICSVVQYLKTNCLIQSNLARNPPRSLISTINEERSYQLYKNSNQCEMETLIHRIFDSLHDLPTMFRMLTICPYLLEERVIEERFLYVLNSKKRNLPGGLAARLSGFMLEYQKLSILKWPLNIVILIVEMLEYHYTQSNLVNIEEIYSVTRLVSFISLENSIPKPEHVDPNQTSSYDMQAPAKLQNSLNALCFVLCGHLFCCLDRSNLLKSRITYTYEPETALRIQSIINVFQSTAVQLPKSMRRNLDVLVNTTI